MVDFKKKLQSKKSSAKNDPLEIYDSLDRASDKGPLRPAQEAILRDWFDKFKDNKDLIIKLHTGQGKTLIGLLILQSKLNLNGGPVMYICPNKYLVKQTCEQAQQFGIKYCEIDETNSLPPDFEDGKSILIIHAQKVFNGKTIFRTGVRAIDVDSVVLDDSHTCIELIKNSFTIRLTKDDQAYSEILDLFKDDLSQQGLALLEEIKNGSFDSFLPVPYWSWQDKEAEVTSILAYYKDTCNAIKFPWEVIKYRIKDCQCFISGNVIEISPHFNPIEYYTSFNNAKHRVLMSATTNNDSFFIKGLGFSKDSINKPLKYEKEKWSGEKMILIPYYIDYQIDSSMVVNYFTEQKAKLNIDRKYGIVALSPSNRRTEYWEKLGATKTESSNIDLVISSLKKKNFDKTIVITNRYDGIDLPDDSCRILIFDSKPYAESLFDKYQEQCRASSDEVNIKLAQKIEQGLGRGVRGEKDYCIIIINGLDLITAIRNKKLQRFFSSQTKKQIEIGNEIIKLANNEIQDYGKRGSVVFRDLMYQSLNRDSGWKDYYIDEMNSITNEIESNSILSILELEKQAEIHYANGDLDKAISCLKKITEEHITEEDEKGWYLQEMARYYYSIDKTNSNKTQIGAHKKNHYLLKPRGGVSFIKIPINQNRTETICKYISEFNDFNHLYAKVEEILNSLRFESVNSDKFERSLEQLGKILGFGSDRPDKYLNEGPDNLWGLGNNNYLLFECKNEVEKNRSEIYKKEAGQMNNSCAWFKDKYPDANFTPVMIIPTNRLAKGAGFNSNVFIMREVELQKLANAVRGFYKDMKAYDLHNLSTSQLSESLKMHKLLDKDFKTVYLKEIHAIK